MIFTTKGLTASLFQQEAKDGDLGKMGNSHFCDKFYKDHNDREVIAGFAVLVSQRMGTHNKRND